MAAALTSRHHAHAMHWLLDLYALLSSIFLSRLTPCYHSFILMQMPSFCERLLLVKLMIRFSFFINRLIISFSLLLMLYSSSVRLFIWHIALLHYHFSLYRDISFLSISYFHFIWCKRRHIFSLTSIFTVYAGSALTGLSRSPSPRRQNAPLSLLSFLILMYSLHRYEFSISWWGTISS